VQGGLGQSLLELGVLALDLAQPRGFAGLHAADGEQVNLIQTVVFLTTTVRLQSQNPERERLGFSCLIAPVTAYSCGFLRTPADFANRPNWPFPATFHFLLAISHSGLAPLNWPEPTKAAARLLQIHV